MITLGKKVDDFKGKQELTVEEIIKRKNNIVSHLNPEEFLEQVELGVSDYDDLIVAFYDYGDGGTGSVFVYISIYEEKGKIQMEYTIASEFQGEVEMLDIVPFGSEQELLSMLQETLISESKRFSELMKENA